MLLLRKIIALSAGLTIGALTWMFLGQSLDALTSNALVVGGISGVMTIISGVLANVGAEKLLGISDRADV